MDTDRARYLDLMGIECWVPRQSSRPAAAAVPSAEPVSADDRASEWTALEAEVTRCVACPLHETRTQTVFGVGDRQATWMVVGEAPGAEEDRQGAPFVGRAGQLLNGMLLALGLARDDVFIANILKCRPPGNRDPRIEEVARCQPFLRRQVELVSPGVILAVGRIAAHHLLGRDDSVGALRGIAHRLPGSETPVVVTYHPAYLLRTPLAKRKAWADLCLARRVLRGES